MRKDCTWQSFVFFLFLSLSYFEAIIKIKQKNGSHNTSVHVPKSIRSYPLLQKIRCLNTLRNITYKFGRINKIIVSKSLQCLPIPIRISQQMRHRRRKQLSKKCDIVHSSNLKQRARWNRTDSLEWMVRRDVCRQSILKANGEGGAEGGGRIQRVPIDFRMCSIYLAWKCVGIESVCNISIINRLQGRVAEWSAGTLATRMLSTCILYTCMYNVCCWVHVLAALNKSNKHGIAFIRT